MDEGEMLSHSFQVCKHKCPLTHALKTSDTKQIAYLIQHGHTNCVNLSHCLVLAIKQKCSWDIISLLLQADTAIIDTRLERGETLLIKYIENLDCVKDLLELGADPNKCVPIFNEEAQWKTSSRGISFIVSTEMGGNALIHAVRFNGISKEIIEMLLNYGADVNARGSSQTTALMYAARKSRLDLAKLFLEAGSDVDAVNEDGQSALMMAVVEDCFEIQKLLLDYGASVSLQDKCQRNALHYSVRCASLPTIKLLYESGCDLFQCEKHSKSPIYNLFFMLARISLIEGLKYLCQIVTEEDVPKLQMLKYHPQDIFLDPSLVKHELLLLNEDIVQVVFNSYIKDTNRLSEMSLHLCSDLVQTETYRFSFFGAYMKHLAQKLFKYPAADLFKAIVPCSIDNVTTALDKLTSVGFEVNSLDPKIISPLTVLMAADSSDISFHRYKCQKDCPKMLMLTKYLIEKEVNFNQRLFRFRDPELQKWSDILQLPDALWAAAMSGHWDCVQYLLQYWSAPPLSLLIFMCPLSTRAMHIGNGIFTLFSILADCGPLPIGSGLYEMVYSSIDKMIDTFQLSLDLMEEFIVLHAEVPSLQTMCRSVLRGSLKSGLSLPSQLDTLVPFGLRDYLKLTFLQSQEENEE